MKKYLSYIILLFSVTIFVLIFFTNVYADTGPKPSIIVKAKNMPEKICYMDLLVDDIQSNYNKEFDKSFYNKKIIEKLKSFSQDNWKPGAINRYSPFGWNIKCDVKSGNSRNYFSYIVPDRFKIIVVTEDGVVVISNIIERKAFNSNVVFDYKSKEAKENHEILSYILQFSKTCLLTLLLEGILLILFGFSLKENLKVFLITNIITQIFLNISIYIGMYYIGLFMVVIIFIICELLIFIIEPIIFVKLFKEHSKKRRFLYGISANMISFIIGTILLYYY